MQQIAVIVPAHNESQNIILLYQELVSVFKTIENINFTLTFIDDGSTDDTFVKVQELSAKDKRVHGLKFSRNFGHQVALKAGIDHCKGDAVIMMDSDLQHPPQLIPKMISHWHHGYKVVATIRNNNISLPWFKRVSARMFYWIINLLSDIPIKPGATDFRLLDKKVVTTLVKMPEQDLFLRGLIPWLGFSSIYIPFQVCNRKYGKTSYTFRKMLALAIDGVSSFSTLPLRIAIYLGFFFSSLSLSYVPYILFSYMQGNAVSGWSSILATIVFFGGIQLVVIGVVGIYLEKVFKQSKGRPLYVLEEQT